MDDNHVVSVPTPEDKSATAPNGHLHTRRKWLLILSVVLATLTLAVIVLIFFPHLFVNDPKALIKSAVGKLSKNSSFSFDAQVYGLDDMGRLTLEGTINSKSQLYSKIHFSFVTTIPDEPEQKFLLDLVFNAEEVYLKPFISSFDQIEVSLLTDMPEVLQSETYKTLRPVMAGDKWVVFKPSSDPSEAVVALKEKYQNLLKAEDIDKLASKFADAVIIRSFDKNSQAGGTQVYKIVAGLDKTKLTELVDEINKVVRNDIMAPYAKELKDAITAVNWNQNLFEILVDKKSGNLRSIDINLPDLSKVGTSLNFQSSDPSSLFYRALTDDYYRAQLEKELRNSQGIPLVRIVTLNFKDFNSENLVTIPKDFLDWNDIWQVIEKELGDNFTSIGGIFGAINPT